MVREEREHHSDTMHGQIVTTTSTFIAFMALHASRKLSSPRCSVYWDVRFDPGYHRNAYRVS
jgi:hypothetical protein